MRKMLLSVAAGLSLLAASSAQAQAYVGANGGWSRVSVDCADTTTCDKNSTGYKAYGGYRFGNNFAIEGLYIDWGNANAQNAGSDPKAMDPVSATLDVSGWGLGVAYFLPITPQLDGVARLGAINSRGKLSGSDGSTSVSSTEDSIEAYFGFGLAYKVTPNFAVTAEGDFSRVKFGGQGDYDNANVQLWSFGLRYSF